MQFTEGQTVVYPHHGPAIVTALTTREVAGVATSYVVLDIVHSRLTVSIPVEKASAIGVRNILDASQLDEIFAVLRAPTVEEEKQWSRRLKDNREKLKVGDILTAASVVRDLVRRRDASGLSLAEREMLRQSQQPLVTEIALSLHLDEVEAEEVFYAALAQDSHLDAVLLSQRGRTELAA